MGNGDGTNLPEIFLFTYRFNKYAAAYGMIFLKTKFLAQQIPGLRSPVRLRCDLEIFPCATSGLCGGCENDWRKSGATIAIVPQMLA